MPPSGLMDWALGKRKEDCPEESELLVEDPGLENIDLPEVVWPESLLSKLLKWGFNEVKKWQRKFKI